jgi:glycine cleavage system regulatory protein
MQHALVMTVIGPDRPGLVDSVATLVASHEGNWLEGRMSRLGGQFAGILRVEVPANREAGLLASLEALRGSGLAIVVHKDPTLAAAASTRHLKSLEVVGQDRPGIIREIARVLASHDINVEELHTECSSAAMSGETLFKARALVNIPEGCDVAAVRRALEKIAEDLIVEISLAEVKSG